MEYSAFPPEVNSGRLTAGPGESSMHVASSAWSQLGAVIASVIDDVVSAVRELAAVGWNGPTGLAASAAFVPYTDWLTGAVAYANEMGAAERALAIAYRAAALTTPLVPVVVGNQVTFDALAATNVLGINSGAMLANRAAYTEMWVQAAGAMDTYSAVANGLAATTTVGLAPPPSIASATPVASLAEDGAPTSGAGGGTSGVDESVPGGVDDTEGAGGTSLADTLSGLVDTLSPTANDLSTTFGQVTSAATTTMSTAANLVSYSSTSGVDYGAALPYAPAGVMGPALPANYSIPAFPLPLSPGSVSPQLSGKSLLDAGGVLNLGITSPTVNGSPSVFPRGGMLPIPPSTGGQRGARPAGVVRGTRAHGPFQPSGWRVVNPAAAAKGKAKLSARLAYAGYDPFDAKRVVSGTGLLGH